MAEDHLAVDELALEVRGHEVDAAYLAAVLIARLKVMRVSA